MHILLLYTALLGMDIYALFINAVDNMSLDDIQRVPSHMAK